MTHGKKYTAVKNTINANQAYDIPEAIKLVKQTSYSKFDATIEVSIKTFANPKYNDQMMRGTVVLPHGTGKSQRIAAFVADENIQAATQAGADIVGYDNLIIDIKAGKLNFDVLVTTPDLMKELAPVAKMLWPKGLMPSPKAGTVTPNIGEAITQIKKGRLEFKIDKTGNIHGIIGKASFDDQALQENLETFIRTVEENKPSGVKNKLIKKVTIAATMGPGIQIATI